MAEFGLRMRMAGATGWVCLVGLVAVEARAAAIDFNRDIQPILSENCFTCHGPDAKERKAGLRLDLETAAKEKSIVVGKADVSLLIERIVSADADELMPPPETGRKLSAKQIALLKRWIKEGAEYRRHWAFEAPVAREMPEADDPWVRNPIDGFVLAELRKAGMRPNAEASRETLIRRASLAVTGLPPTPEEVDAFLNDAAPDAYEKVVERLLKSERFGERMAMWWLDGARYADSHGFQADWERYQWPWREWVVRAFNRNLSFDQFTIEQLAGDLLPEATRDQILATGFNRNHRVNTEGGSLDAEWLVENVVDRVETMGSVWLGLTLNCARCHDHKYDPISQTEFYQLFAFFHNVPEKGKGPGKQGNFEPVLKLPTAEDEAELARLDSAIREATAEVKRQEKGLAQVLVEWERRVKAEREAKSPWQPLRNATVESKGGAEILYLGDGSILPVGKQAQHEVYTIRTRVGAGKIAGIRLEAIPDAAMHEGRLGRARNGNFVLSGVEVELRPPGVEEAVQATIVKAEASYEQKGWPIASVVDRKHGKGWAVDGNRLRQRRHAVFQFSESLKTTAGAELVIRLRCEALSQHALGRFRLFTTDSASAGLDDDGGVPAEIQKILEVAEADRDAKQWEKLRKHVGEKGAPKLTAAKRRLDKLKKEKAAVEKRIPSAMVMAEMAEPRVTRFLKRGQYDLPGDVVQPGLPAAFPGLPEGAPTNRLGLARWIVSRDNPLTARVQVNRIWELLFGAGIVKSSENLGTQAEWPSHPELLDWLATDFVRSGWDLKALMKRMLTSATYRQDAAATAEKLRVDPENRLLSRGPRFRVQAEVVRDQALYLAGLLVEKVGGPSVYPYQPAGIWSEFNFYGNLRNYKHAKDTGLYRRSLYTIWKRTAAPPGMTLFDMPSREICTVKRPRTNTPLQALALMNDVTYVEASRKFAERILAAGKETDERIRAGFRLATARWPKADELATLRAGFERRLKYYEQHPEAAEELLKEGEADMADGVAKPELAAMSTVASVLLNLDETITN